MNQTAATLVPGAALTSSATPRTLADLFERAAALHPERIAVTEKGTSIRFAELAHRARGLAARLAAAGLGPGQICGLHLERSIDGVVAMLAVTMCGAAWLPLDPHYPPPRLELMIRDADARHLVTRSDIKGLSLADEVQVLNPEPLSDRGPTYQDTLFGPDERAYVIYTSGSTGRPKGVQIEHGAIVAFLQSMQGVLEVGPDDIFFSVSSPSFDISILDVFVPLSRGASVALASREEAQDGRLLARRLADVRPTFLQATPATWKMLLACGWNGDPELTALTGAEPIAPSLARDLMARTRAVWNLYGPTETTVWMSATRLTEADVASAEIPIGRPLDHASALVLDGEGLPVAAGTIGELYIQGSGLARGFIGDDKLTAERFVTLPAGRAYRTGDRVRWRADGQLAFHGRIDHQIKLNGFRIEPAEVETVLRSHAAVLDTVVAAKRVAGEQRLVAYVVPTRATPAADLPTDLKAHCKRALPLSMCPAVYVVVEAMPLTPSGKVDRRALPDVSVTTGADAPRGAMQRQVAGLFSDALGLSPIGPRDNFFALGGDSLATITLLAAVERELGVAIELTRFVEQPTVEGLAALVHANREGQRASSVITLNLESKGAPLFMVPGAGGLGFTVFEVAQALISDRPVHIMQDPAFDPDVEPLRSVEAIATAQVGQIRAIQPNGPYHLCGHSFGGLVAFEIGVQLRAAGEEVAFLALLDTPTPPVALGADRIGERLRRWWRELRFMGQILAQAGPMAADGCYVLFGAEARFHATTKEATLKDAALALWSGAMFRLFQRQAGLAFAVSPESRLMMLRQPGIRRSIQLTGIHDRARRRYRPSRFDGLVTLIRATEDSAETSGFENGLGWDRYAARVGVNRCPGTHFTMARGDNAKRVATMLDRRLDRATAREDG